LTRLPKKASAMVNALEINARLVAVVLDAPFKPVMIVLKLLRSVVKRMGLRVIVSNFRDEEVRGTED